MFRIFRFLVIMVVSNYQVHSLLKFAFPSWQDVTCCAGNTWSEISLYPKMICMASWSMSSCRSPQFSWPSSSWSSSKTWSPHSRLDWKSQRLIYLCRCLSVYGTYITPLQGNYSEALPAQARTKRKVLSKLKKKLTSLVEESAIQEEGHSR